MVANSWSLEGEAKTIIILLRQQILEKDYIFENFIESKIKSDDFSSSKRFKLSSVGTAKVNMSNQSRFILIIFCSISFNII
jgi:hypothetical protein